MTNNKGFWENEERKVEAEEEKLEEEVKKLSTKAKFPIKLFGYALLAYAIGMLGAYALHLGDAHLAITNQTAYQVTPAVTHLGISTGVIYIILAMVMIIGTTIVILKIRKLNLNQFFQVFYAFIMFYLPFALALQLGLALGLSFLIIFFGAIAIGIVAATLYWHHKKRINVWAMLIAITAIILIGSDLPPTILLALLCLAATWDYIAVFVIHYMQRMVKRMASLEQMPPIALIDGSPEDLVAKLQSQEKGSKPKKEVGLLGLGDVILPGSVIASFAYFGLPQLALAFFGATVLGLWLDIEWSRLRHIAIPALVLIALADVAVLILWLVA